MTRRNVIGLAVWIGVTFAPAVLGAAFGPGEWYLEIRKPSWTPPGWVFGPVWTLLYAAMGVAAWLVWREPSAARGPALGVFVAQLVLNALWSPAFFGLRSPGLALVVIVALWVAILATIVTFWRVRPLAGAMLTPYLAWVSFASALNFAIWRLNAG